MRFGPTVSDGIPIFRRRFDSVVRLVSIVTGVVEERVGLQRPRIDQCKVYKGFRMAEGTLRAAIVVDGSSDIKTALDYADARSLVLAHVWVGDQRITYDLKTRAAVYQ
jgi:hypothetical protein